jgi:hypothetical protein
MIYSYERVDEDEQDNQGNVVRVLQAQPGMEVMVLCLVNGIHGVGAGLVQTPEGYFRPMSPTLVQPTAILSEFVTGDNEFKMVRVRIVEPCMIQMEEEREPSPPVRVNNFMINLDDNEFQLTCTDLTVRPDRIQLRNVVFRNAADLDTFITFFEDTPEFEWSCRDMDGAGILTSVSDAERQENGMVLCRINISRTDEARSDAVDALSVTTEELRAQERVAAERIYERCPVCTQQFRMNHRGFMECNHCNFRISRVELDRAKNSQYDYVNNIIRDYRARWLREQQEAEWFKESRDLGVIECSNDAPLFKIYQDSYIKLQNNGFNGEFIIYSNYETKMRYEWRIINHSLPLTEFQEFIQEYKVQWRIKKDLKDGIVVQCDMKFRGKAHVYTEGAQPTPKRPEPKEFTVNELITLRLECKDGFSFRRSDNRLQTNIYVGGQLFRQCKYLLLNLDTSNKEVMEAQAEIDSIDEAKELFEYKTDMEHDHNIVPPEVEFWGHCSNLQVFVENDYDIRVLHSSISLPLCVELVKHGVEKARGAIVEEITSRLMKGAQKDSVRQYLKHFSKVELESLEAMLPPPPPPLEPVVQEQIGFEQGQMNPFTMRVMTLEDVETAEYKINECAAYLSMNTHELRGLLDIHLWLKRYIYNPHGRLPRDRLNRIRAGMGNIGGFII